VLSQSLLKAEGNKSFFASFFQKKKSLLFLKKKKQKDFYSWCYTTLRDKRYVTDSLLAARRIRLRAATAGRRVASMLWRFRHHRAVLGLAMRGALAKPAHRHFRGTAQILGHAHIGQGGSREDQAGQGQCSWAKTLHAHRENLLRYGAPQNSTSLSHGPRRARH
jgi:hypothetical protein